MNEIYHIEGTLNKGFVGQIAYTVCLEQTYHRLDVEFSFDKRRYSPEEITPELIAETKTLRREKYDLSISDDEARRIILDDMKTELHTLATLNDQFIGCVHKQLTDRHMTYDGDFASEGCIPQHEFDGVLTVTVLAFNVLKDATHYALTVRAE